MSEGCGHWQGLSAAPGASCRNLSIWNRDSATATSLLMPGMCFVLLKFPDAAHHVKSLINLIMH